MKTKKKNDLLAGIILLVLGMTCIMLTRSAISQAKSVDLLLIAAGSPLFLVGAYRLLRGMVKQDDEPVLHAKKK